ncbi:membrane-spanning 4-domains subfamily A member 4A-like [Cynoglossus semilaevis]|uniref:membrane-spanning 4-domains subfamily A member 4A-like n=1 Tax=Cynoglossus semilaevis TaxID=244447 RepID=UPI000496FBE7|nr:membrane-spanning 4-domains subfamily A member 4A-like [Cynoglossus semilaevis]XP_024916229.1 membrane-spanning 4-domains subfamily A member 4A-like [Cynoglossus semilaevis]
MSSSQTNRMAGGVIITQFHPAPNDPIVAAGATIQQYQNKMIQKFSAGRPQVLGVIQIMVGLIVLLFGIAATPVADSVGVFSGIFVWGAALYITAGSLTVAAGKRLNRCLVKGALGVSVVAALAATAAFIIHTMDAALIYLCYGYPGFGPVEYCYMYQLRMQGISGVLAVFNLLELIVAITVAGYACSATCNCNNVPPVVVTISNEVEVRGQTAGLQFQKEFQNCQPEPPLYSTVINP